MHTELMATAPLEASRISVEEYLKSVYQPDCDYTDGVVEERNLGERDHSEVQVNLAAFFRNGFKVTGIKAWVEWRFQISSTRFRVPDVTVMRGQPSEQILTMQPLMIAEILSPEDRPTRVKKRVQEYLDFGVPVVWVIDPQERTIQINRPGSIEQASDPVKLDGTDIEVPFSEIFD